MRTVELSNHPVQLLRREHARQSDAETQQQAAYAHALSEHNARVVNAKAARDTARAEHHWLRWLRGALALSVARSQTPRPPGPVRANIREEARLTAGVQGEQSVRDQLAAALDDDWVLLCGYRNRRGEIDQLLLSPNGALTAIEIKHRNATVHCTADEWTFQKYDRYGNQVEQGRITDRRGRSPSTQLNEPADELETFLARHSQHVTIDRVVILTHPRSRLGTIAHNTVHICTDAGYVLQLAAAQPTNPNPARRDSIEQLTIQDHTHHEQHRQPRQKNHHAKGPRA